MAADRKPYKFSHPTEAAFSRILDFYGIAWEYEPRTFALKWDKDGNVTEAFTPDFYLPDQELFIELTTLRPKLSTYKNRRIRRMKELYPEVNIKLFKRRELHTLMIKFGLMDEAGRIQGTEAQLEDKLLDEAGRIQGTEAQQEDKQIEEAGKIHDTESQEEDHS